MFQAPSDSNTVILVTQNGMGNADQELKHTLVATYFRLLLMNNFLPAAICFYTEGVRLAVEGSPVIKQLQELESKNVRLILCSTCLNYFGLAGQAKAGIVGGMNDILEAQWRASKVITI